jgi:glycosyltransferase involved in cell wall biosynthesis
MALVDSDLKLSNTAETTGKDMAENHAPLLGGLRNKGIAINGTEQQPLVTVVTAIFNGRQYVEGCLESVLCQDYPNIEHLILDAGSTDGTIEILRRFDERIAYWKSEPDRGLYDAWNKALQIARGEWICFLGVDDVLLPGAIRSYMELAMQHPEAEYLSARVRWVHPDGYQRINGKPWRWGEFARWMCVSHVGSMHRRWLYERLGNYDLSYGSAADYELLLRARQTLQAAFMPVVTAIMRTGGVSDGPRAFADATRAKIVSGGRNPMLAKLELRIGNVRYHLRPLRRAAGRLKAKFFSI